jgi:Tfp pilus assembly protein PilN
MEQQINLFQPILGAEKRLFSARAIGVALAAFALCLAGVAGFARWRTAHIERAVIVVGAQEAQTLTLAAQANAANEPHASLAELEAQGKRSAGEIAAREHALNIVLRGSADPLSGFAERLEAIGRRQVEGVWLTSLVIGTGEGRLALSGATTDARLIAGWLASLEQEPALDGAYFDRLVIKQVADAAPAMAVFDIGAPGLDLSAPGGTR